MEQEIRYNKNGIRILGDDRPKKREVHVWAGVATPRERIPPPLPKVKCVVPQNEILPPEERIPNSYPLMTRQRLAKRDRYFCVYCGKPKPNSVDHVVSRARGGLNIFSNLVLSCSDCNSSKGSDSILIWLYRLKVESVFRKMETLEKRLEKTL